MKKLYLSLALALGLAGATPAAAQTSELVVTSEGQYVTTLEEISELAANNTPVMLYNASRQKFYENHDNGDGTHRTLVGYDFAPNVTGNQSFLWRLVPTENPDEYRLLSVEDGKYLFMMDHAGQTPPYPTTTTASADSVDSYVVTLSDYEATDQYYAHTFYFASTACAPVDGAPICLNGQGMEGGSDDADIVGWQKGNGGNTTVGNSGDNSAIRVYVPTVESKSLYTVTFKLNFFDGTTDNNIAEDETLADLVPASVAETLTATAQAAVGDTVLAPTFANNQIRNLTNGETVVSDSGSFKLTAEMVAGGAYTVEANYSSDPRITFNMTQDVSMFTDVFEGDYGFSNGLAEMEASKRVATGDSITAPTETHFTLLTKIEEVATQSKTIEVAYRPWRAIYYDCITLLDDGQENVFVSSAEMYVDVDSVVNAPDAGNLYTFNAEATNASGLNIDAEGNPLNIPFTVTPENISAGAYLTFYYDIVDPVKTTEVGDDAMVPEEGATWYIIRMRGSKVLTATANDNGYLICDASAKIDDNALWCFSKNADGTYFLYNKANNGLVLCDVGGDAPQLVQPQGIEQGFEILNITSGYGFRVMGTDKVWNDLENKNPGQLAYWENASATNDAGSTVTFEEYVASRYTFLDGRAALNAVGCINGYTEDQVAEIREIIEEGNTELQGDVTMLVEELIDTPADELIQHNPANGYAIVTAAPAYVQKDNVQYALYIEGDTILSWREFNKWDKNFYFELGDMQTLTGAVSGADSIVCSLKSIATNLYVDGRTWTFNKPLSVGEEFNDTTMLFHLAPAVAEMNDEGEVTLAAVPAGFYIDRLWYDGGDTTKAKVKCTMSMHGGTVTNNATRTQGNIVSYNTHGADYANVFRFWDGGPIETVGIGSVTNDENAADAQKNAEIYDLSGRRVQKAVKGIYIQNGKKVYVK